MTMESTRSGKRASTIRNEILQAKQVQLEEERGKKRDQAELREALVELRKLSGCMGGAKAFELGQNSLREWADVITKNVLVIEQHIKKVVQPPTPPCNKLLDANARRESPVANPYVNASLVPQPNVLSFTYHDYLSSAMYFLLEAITTRLRSERAVVYQYVKRTDELQAACIVNSGFVKPCTIKASATTGWCGEVFSKGITVNVSHAYSALEYDVKQDRKMGYRIRSLLCVPLLFNNGQRFGVLQVTNKNCGTASFNEEDEAALIYYSDLMVYLMQRYPNDTVNTYFDPTPLHKAHPWKPSPPIIMAIPTSPKPHLVYRTRQSGHINKAKPLLKEGSEIQMQKNISEVDAHIKSLEESWMKSVHLNVDFEKENEDTMQRMRELRDLVKQKKKHIKELTAEVDLKNDEIAKLRFDHADRANNKTPDTPIHSNSTLGLFLNHASTSFLPNPPTSERPRKIANSRNSTVSTVSKLPSVI